MMLRYIYLIGLLSFISSSNLMACDACGCSLSQLFWGMNPDNNLSYFGLWYQHQRYASSFGSNESLVGSSSQERFNTVEIRAKINLKPKIQVLAIVPYQYHIRTSEAQQNSINGLGDISLLANYLLWQSPGDTTLRKVKQQLKIGAGLKTPTGRFTAFANENALNPNFQLGSGSWDLLFSLSYNAQMKDVGWNADFIYRLNGSNANDYRFGNRWNGSLNFFYSKNLPKIEIIPAVGLFFEQAAWDVQEQYYKTYTGGHAWFGTFSMETYFRGFNLGINYLQPIQADWSNGALSPNSRWAAHMNFYF